MTIQHVFWGKTSWNESKRVDRAGELSRSAPDAPSGRRPLARSSSRPTTAASSCDRCLASIARHRPPDRSCPIEVVVADDGSTRRHGGVARRQTLPRRPGGPAGAERRLLRGGQRRNGRRSGPFHPAPQQRHRGYRGLGRGRTGPVRRRDGRLGRAPGSGAVGPEAGRLGRRYLCLVGLAGEARPRPAGRISGRIDPSTRSSAPAAAAPSTAPRPCGAPDGFDPLLGSLLRGHRPGLPPAMGRLPLRFHSRLPRSITTSPRPTTIAAPHSSAGCPAMPSWSSGANLPPRLLALAVVPHLAFVIGQAAWRLARGRLGPFVAGKARRAPRLASDPRTPPRPVTRWLGPRSTASLRALPRARWRTSATT